jgi:polyhydroxyalkanoate synthesis regulator phasin
MILRTSVFVGVAALAVGMTLVIGSSTVAQAPKGYSRDIPGEETPSVVPNQYQNRYRLRAMPAPTAAQEMAEAAKKATAEADAAESEYRNAVEANRKEPGTMPEAEVERLHRIYSDSLLSATSKQVRSLRAEVDELRSQVQDLKTVKVRPLTISP